MLNLSQIILPLIFCFAAFLAPAGCTYDEPVQNVPVSDTIKFSHSLKGWELYSWYQQSEWHYSIIIGTNRLKSCDEVLNNRISVTSLSQLQQLLAKMPANEEIMWLGEDWIRQTWPESCAPLSLPDDSTVDNVRQFCRVYNLRLTVVR